jgi:hypothetical protein
VDIEIDILGAGNVATRRQFEYYAGGHRPSVSIAARKLLAAKYLARRVDQSKIRRGLFRVDVDGIFQDSVSANGETSDDLSFFLGAARGVRLVVIAISGIQRGYRYGWNSVARGGLAGHMSAPRLMLQFRHLAEITHVKGYW